MPRYSTKLKPKPKSKPNRWLLWLGLAGIGLVALALWAVFNSSAQAQNNIQVKGEPRLQVDTEFIDHGVVKLGVPITDQITITNIGDRTLVFQERPIVQVKEGC